MKYPTTILALSLALTGCFERGAGASAAKAEVTASASAQAPAAKQARESRQPGPGPAAASADCRNLHRAADIDDLVRQIYDNLDSPCLFAQDTQALADVWGVHNVDMLNMGLPGADGAFAMSEATAHKLEQKLLQNARWYETASGLALEWGKSESRGSGEAQPRVTRYFKIAVSQPYQQQHGGYGGSFRRGGLPDFLSRSGKLFENQRVYRWFNRQRSADLPYLEIGFDPQTRAIESISVYEKVENPLSGIHRM